MTRSEQILAGILLRVARGQVTVAQLRQRLADGIAAVEALGEKKAAPDIVEGLAVLESAILRIEASKARITGRKNN
jgi:hypothetical protein